MKNIANIINFARGCEPRAEDDSFLFSTLREELELCKQFGFRSTVLLQYDALLDPAYPALVKSGYDVEPGLWLEVVQPLAEAAGIPWRGRYVWDWDIRCNFLSAYTPDERKTMIDAAFRTFREIFGAYPAVAGCWSIDATSLAYMQDTYGLKAFCLCKEQFGTDGITLWGGYYTGGYYPSANNALLPAREAINQIRVPVFRMLGPDPVDQYDLGLGAPDRRQSVCSLEPVYAEGGGNPEWVDWFLRENYSPKALSFAYAQFGQENSFGWRDISKGLPMQLEKLRQKADTGEIEVLTLGEAGEWFRSAYALSPVNSCCTDTDIRGGGRRSAWYYSCFYRVNILYENGTAWIRDLQLYSDRYKEQYLHRANIETHCGNFALPVTDGFRFSADGVRAGIYPYIGDKQARGEAFISAVQAPDTLAAQCGGVSFTAQERRFSVRCVLPGFRLLFRYASLPQIPYRRVEAQTLSMAFSGFAADSYPYRLRLLRGTFRQTDGALEILPDQNGEIVLDCAADD